MSATTDLLHWLWSRVPRDDNYDKSKWVELQLRIEKLEHLKSREKKLMSIPTFEEKKNELTSIENKKTKELLLRIEEAIRKSDRLDNISVDADGYSSITIDVVKRELASKGWWAKFDTDQRDGCFLYIGSPKENTWYDK